MPMDPCDPRYPVQPDPADVPTLPPMKATWTGTASAADHDDDTEAMRAAGIFDEADAFFDLLESGADVLNDHHDPAEWVEQVKLRRPA